MLVSKVETYDKANATNEMVKALQANQKMEEIKLCDEVVKDNQKNTNYQAAPKTLNPNSITTTNGKTTCYVTKTEDLRYVMVR